MSKSSKNFNYPNYIITRQQKKANEIVGLDDLVKTKKLFYHLLVHILNSN